jgi:hypothetical protein
MVDGDTGTVLLAMIGTEEPQLALSAYTKGVCHRWSYLQRTVGGIEDNFQLLEQAIRSKLIPAIVGREVSNNERDMIALPVRYGGLGLQNPCIIALREYKASLSITEELRNLIYTQDSDITKLNHETVRKKKDELKLEKEAWFKYERERISNLVASTSRKRAFEHAAEKGVSSWISALPLKALGYSLNKQEFRNALCIRYDWPIPNLHRQCACGEKNDIDHTLTCKKGGYVYYRHNVLAEAEAELLREAKCRNVHTEPGLLPTVPELHPKGTITTDGARLDIVATGLYGRCERTFMDVRITHANTPSNRALNLEQIYSRNENEKKRKYNSRVINTEKSTFVPLVFTTTGGQAPECQRYHKRVAELIASKRNENLPHVMSYIRTKISFALLKAVLVSIHGVRGKQTRNYTPVKDISFGLIPTEDTYECR